MDVFEQIDAEREQHGFTRVRVYERAQISGETWRRLARKRHEPNMRTLRKLRVALDALIAEKSADLPPEVGGE